MASITTRQTAGTGATVNPGPLSNEQLDNNFININAELVGKAPLNSPIFTGTPEINSTTALKLAAGTTEQRPSGTVGQIRYNTSTNTFEGFGTAWGALGGGGSVAVGSITGLASGVATFLATSTSANLLAAITDETGTGALVFGTSPTLTTPRIASITDSNNNERIIFNTVTNAVNEITITNAIAGSGPIIAATGSSDQNIDLNLNAKGTGTVKITNLNINGAYTEKVFTITDGATVDLSPSNGTVQLWTLGANRTPTATNFAAGTSMTLMIDDGTAYTITWTSIPVTWIGGSQPFLATTGYTVIQLWKVGTVVYGATIGST